MRIIRNAEEGRELLLSRKPLDADELPMDLRELTFKTFGQELAPDEVVRRIIRDVREDGDNGVSYYNSRLDGSATPELRVSDEEMHEAYDACDNELVEALRFAAGRVRDYHEQQMRGAKLDFNNNGLGQVTRAIKRAGIYVPGTRAPLPSTVIMCAIPARVAGVEEVYLTSPVLPDGTVPAAKLVAADIAGVDAVFKAGGAQGIAAFAYGTETIPRVDKIFGPGGLFVTIAKKQVFGDVGIDSVYGPTETVIIADESADPENVAADLLAQAEHDPLASPILLTPSHYFAEEVGREMERQLAHMERAKIAQAAIDNRGGCILVNDIDHGIELANYYGPEHLCLCVENPTAYVMKVTNAGGLFLGEASPEAVGDYTAGPSHTMPTGGSARWSGPLGVGDFLKRMAIVHLPDEDSEQLNHYAAIIARAEGLTGHAHAVERRLRGAVAMDYRRFLREDIGALEEYEPVKPLDVLAEEIGVPISQLVKLDANENLYGAPAAVYDAIADADLHIYPDPGQNHLREAIADYVGCVTPEQVVGGTGADDLIDLVLRLTLPEKVAVVTPAFGMYSFLAKINRVQPIEVPRRADDFSLDVDGLRQAVDDGARIVFLTSPNNPTGNALTIAQARAVCEMDALVIIDEAYIEFGGESAAPLLAEFSNLVVLRTFSKWAGIAGLRVGYALCDPEFAKLMMAIKQPYNVNVAADVAARAAIEHRAEIFETVRALIAERGRMVKLVGGLGWLHPLPSDANFVLFKVEGRPAKLVAKGLRQQGVLVRYYDRPDLANYVRISAGRPEDTDRLVAALKNLETA